MIGLSIMRTTHGSLTDALADFVEMAMTIARAMIRKIVASMVYFSFKLLMSIAINSTSAAIAMTAIIKRPMLFLTCSFFSYVANVFETLMRLAPYAFIRPRAQPFLLF